MSDEVKVNNTDGLTLKAGNTVETLAPKPAVAPAKVEAPKEAKKEVIEKITEHIHIEIKETESIEWSKRPVSRREFQELADAVQELAERIARHNQGAPHKI